jgi:hypothetical protein
LKVDGTAAMWGAQKAERRDLKMVFRTAVVKAHSSVVQKAVTWANHPGYMLVHQRVGRKASKKVALMADSMVMKTADPLVLSKVYSRVACLVFPKAESRVGATDSMTAECSDTSTAGPTADK